MMILLFESAIPEVREIRDFLTRERYCVVLSLTRTYGFEILRVNESISVVVLTEQQARDDELKRRILSIKELPILVMENDYKDLVRRLKDLK